MSTDRRSLFSSLLSPTPSKSDNVDLALLRRCERRLDELESMTPLSGLDLKNLLAANGVSRRAFLGWTSAATALLMLHPWFEPLVARAAEVMNRVPVIWFEGQDCAGNSEAFLHANGPTIDELLFNVISLEYHETLMAAAGFQAEERLQQATKDNHGKYLLVIEGSIPRGLNGAYATIGPNATPFIETVTELAPGAAAVIAVGNCANFGGLPAAHPNPTHAVGVSDVVKGTPIVNIGSCPINPVNFNGTLLHYTLTGQLPALDSLLRPKFAFGYRIHDNCERRAHFDAGEYVQQWGDDAARNNFCLYKMGCKGPMAFNNCSIVRYNEGTNWPVGAGHGCIACAAPNFWDRYATERPMAEANIRAPGLFGGGVESGIDKFGVGLLSVAGAGIAVHAALTATARRRDRHGKTPEPELAEET
ncbi:hydrogenase small subunit [Candidatus Mycobacterium methanotrophicum]|uniref:Hydrogenase small subunit n=1 Tax=Candidatus Mycobacterium methanotrophicum TaxID=2943498 RepID=A0ABY4QL08_9MYCO|nr:hydrogenase small subunit [Candidatus Mycobacterium methanotrophicum]UQX11276.1 hydrogenase small subunit [Candidatus Mycobacterium methanotrophicum]